MKALKQFLQSLLSRKFLITVGAVATAIATKDYYVGAAAAIAYVLAEAHIDAASAKTVATNASAVAVLSHNVAAIKAAHAAEQIAADLPTTSQGA